MNASITAHIANAKKPANSAGFFLMDDDNSGLPPN